MSLHILEMEKIQVGLNIMNIELNTEEGKSRNEGKIGFLG